MRGRANRFIITASADRTSCDRLCYTTHHRLHAQIDRAQTYDGSVVTRQGVTHFSDWAVGDNTGPTDVRLLSASADVVSQPFSLFVPFVIALGMLGLFLIQRQAHLNR